MPANSRTRHGNGSGVGGPANGGGGRPAAPFTEASETRERVAHLDNRDEIEQAYRAKRRAERRAQKEVDEEAAQDLRDHLLHKALTADTDANQISATVHWLNRHEGLPVARNVNLNVGDIGRLSDEEIEAELARIGGEGTTPPA